MASTAVFTKLTFTTTVMNTTTANSLSAYIANTSVVNSFFFKEYQDTAVECELTIWTIIPPGISAEPYRKTIIVILFFHHILSLSSSPSVAISDLTATVATYCGIPTGSAERILDSVRHTFFDVGNLQGIGSWPKILFLSFHSIAFARA